MNLTKKILCLFLGIVVVSVIYGDMDTSPVRVNQVGYFPQGDKIATIIDARTYGLSWELRNSAGQTVFSGTTDVYGNDAASGDHVHKADFSAFTTAGTGYTLQVSGAGTSVPFDIAADIYTGLEQDAMDYFYFHRMGVSLQSQHLQYPGHSRAALHTESSVTAYNNWTSDTFDVRYSWADAGDFGIYPVNHAISAWTLLNLYERDPSVFPDNSLNIPESGNGISDLLDEVRFGSTFMYNMLPSSGLASHKVHNVEWSSPWTYTNFAATENSATRHAQPPSTNATYAVARTLAHLARVFQSADPSYASSIWARAELAWQRADADPDVLYNGVNDDPGGGDYADNTISDDRYSAACELYLTAYKRGDNTLQTYRNAVTGNPNYMAVTDFNWTQIQATGTLSLLVADNDLSSSDLNVMRNSVIDFADENILPYLTQGDYMEEGYPVPLDGDEGYDWGSNSIVMNNLIIAAYAYDFTNDPTYLKAIAMTLDYMMGNNAMRLSYITGWGEYAEEDPHDRWAIACLNDRDVPVPSGWLIGGPNNKTINDNATPADAPAAKSYAQPGTGAEAWCSKENTINWNAPLVWIAWYINDNSSALGGGSVNTPTPTPVITPSPTPEPVTPTPGSGGTIDTSEGRWGTYIDPYGSTVSPPEGANALEDGIASAEFEMEPEPTSTGKYPFGGLFFNFDDDETSRHIALPIRFKYKSSGTIRFNLSQPGLEDNGEAWGYNLPSSSSWRTIEITESMIAQPSWVSSSTPLDLTTILQLKWEPKMGSSGGYASISVTDLELLSGEGPEPVTYGDVNGDGYVTIVDALMTAQYSVGTSLSNFNPEAADVNSDGRITIIDALVIAQYSVGLIDSLPV